MIPSRIVEAYTIFMIAYTSSSQISSNIGHSRPAALIKRAVGASLKVGSSGREVPEQSIHRRRWETRGSVQGSELLG